jgi:putative transposase
LAVTPHRRYAAAEKQLLLETVQHAQIAGDVSVRHALQHLGIGHTTYDRWTARAETGRLADDPTRRARFSTLPTPPDRAAVCEFARAHPLMGYKRLAWDMIDRDIAYLRPSQVDQVLQSANLLARRPPRALDPLQRPAPPDRPDQVWHVDLMYLYIRPRWYYLVDILDGYSRYLVHWKLNLTMQADLVMLAVQEALETLPGRRPGEPQLVHDHGSQFISREWRTFVTLAGAGDIRTRVAHPESNGRLERLHRTHREEGLIDEDLTSYGQGLDAMARWRAYYNHHRPHSALRYLRPIDYYRGDPDARLVERRQKLQHALIARQDYWKIHGDQADAAGG